MWKFMLDNNIKMHRTNSLFLEWEMIPVVLLRNPSTIRKKGK